MRGKNFWNSLLLSNMMSDARKKEVMEYLCAQEVDFTNLFPDDLGLKQQAERDYYLSRGFSKRQADNFVEYGDVRGTEIEYQEEKHLEQVKAYREQQGYCEKCNKLHMWRDER